MLFNSLDYAIFLPFVFLIYWALPIKFRWLFLLAASYYFYMSWNAKYLLLIILTTIISYVAAILIEDNISIGTDKKVKKDKFWIMVITVIVCLSILFLFKYYNFFISGLTYIAGKVAINIHLPTLKLLLPIGISFYTFQTLGYVIDVYRGKVRAERNIGIYATFISYFPQLVAGPIERAQNLLPQIKNGAKFDYGKATYGMKLMAWGFFKKLVIADVLAKYVDLIYKQPDNYQGFVLVLATLFFTIQIYCDFSGYSDIAIGTSKLLGIDLISNFNSPYYSVSIKDFWNRWHISLSTWFKDYVYIPLGGNKVGKLRHCFNLLVTFLVSGLWHGANITFVIWGGLHGIALIFETLILRKMRIVIPKSISIIGIFSFVALAWVFFRANTLNDALLIINHMFNGINNPNEYLIKGIEAFKLPAYRIYSLPITICLLFIYDYFAKTTDVITFISLKEKWIRYSVYLLILTMIVILRPSEEVTFVYFQF